MGTPDEDFWDRARGNVIRDRPDLVGALDDGATAADLGDDAAFFDAIDAEHSRIIEHRETLERKQREHEQRLRDFT